VIRSSVLHRRTPAPNGQTPASDGAVSGSCRDGKGTWMASPSGQAGTPRVPAPHAVRFSADDLRQVRRACPARI